MKKVVVKSARAYVW